ncbi:MAG: hypothetical protein ACRDJH_03140 [Thermomicrobiales bacterium]
MSREEIEWAGSKVGDAPARPAAPVVVAARRSPRLPLLSTRAGIRQAILMQEVLGPPKSLRRSSSDARADDV